MANDVPPYYVTNTVRVEVRYFMQNNNAANVFHVGYDSPPSITELNALGGAIEDWLTASWKPLSSQDWSANQILLTDLGGATGKRLSYPIDPIIVGSGVDNAMPANVTLAVKADIGIRGRGRSGRLFWVGLGESAVDGNLVVEAARTGIIAAMEALNTAIEGLTAFNGMVVPHSFETTAGVQHHLNPAESAPIVSFALTDNSIDTQKDRLPFHKKRKVKPTTTP